MRNSIPLERLEHGTLRCLFFVLFLIMEQNKKYLELSASFRRSGIRKSDRFGRCMDFSSVWQKSTLQDAVWEIALSGHYTNAIAAEY